MLAKKLVLLSMVAVRPPFAKLAIVAVPPRLSASAMTAPPCNAPKRLLRSSRTGSSATTLSGETWIILMPSKAANGGCCSASEFIAKFIGWAPGNAGLGAGAAVLIAEHGKDGHPRRGTRRGCQRSVIIYEFG